MEARVMEARVMEARVMGEGDGGRRVVEAGG